jgi:outer membrane biosynthesis protein TonB
VALLAACADPAPPDRAGTGPSSQRPAGASTGLAGTGCPNPGAGPEPDASGVRHFVRGHLRAVRDCYDRALKKNPGRGGKALLRFTVGTCGQVDAVRVVSRTGDVSEAASCVEQLARGWRTSFRPAAPVGVEYPLSFSTN